MSVILIRCAVDICWFFLLSKIFLSSLSLESSGIEEHSPTTSAVTKMSLLGIN